MLMAGTVNSKARREADFHHEALGRLVGQGQLLGKARNSHCRPQADGYDRLLSGRPALPDWFLKRPPWTSPSFCVRSSGPSL